MVRLKFGTLNLALVPSLLNSLKLDQKLKDVVYLAKRAVDTKIWQWTGKSRHVILLLLLLLLLLLSVHHETFQTVSLSSLNSIDHVISRTARVAVDARSYVGHRGNALSQSVGQSIADRGRSKK